MAESILQLARDPALRIYENDKVVAILSPTPSAAGHVMVMPRENFLVLGQIPDYVLGEMFTVASRISSVIFESLGAQGTNLLIQNGVEAGQDVTPPVIHIIPRREGDSINLLWQPKKFSEEEMGTAALRLNEETKNIGGFEREKQEPVEEKPVENLKDEDAYLLRQLERMP